MDAKDADGSCCEAAVFIHLFRFYVFRSIAVSLVCLQSNSIWFEAAYLTFHTIENSYVMINLCMSYEFIMNYDWDCQV